jgi:hypothetical protein
MKINIWVSGFAFGLGILELGIPHLWMAGAFFIVSALAVFLANEM